MFAQVGSLTIDPLTMIAVAGKLGLTRQALYNVLQAGGRGRGHHI
jgi:hypothetical protein